MTDGNGGPGGEPSHLSRRRLLAGLGGLGAIGTASGAGTFAYFSDEDEFRDNGIGAGEVELDVSCSGSNENTDCSVSNGTVSFSPEDPIDRGHRGDVTLEVSVRTNPARLWIGTDCPPIYDDLGDALEVSLRIDDEWILPSGSLSDLRRAFVDGLRIDDLDGDPCLDPEGDALAIEFAWELPEDAPAGAAGETVEFEFHLYSEQCRHVSEDDAAGSNPFAGFGPCDEPPECAVCDGDAEDTYRFLEFEYLGDETAYVSAVTQGKGTNGGFAFRGTVDPGGTFVAHGANVNGDPGSLGSNLYIDDGGDGQRPSESNGRPAGIKVHTSCSVDLFVGQEFEADGVTRCRLVGGEILGKGPLCGPEELR